MDAAKTHRIKQDFPVLGMERFLKPIHSQNPSGPSVRYESCYDAIAKARREDEDLPRGIWEINLKKSQWDVVEGLCIQLLCEQSKDLQVAAWLAEAWLSLYGVAGLTHGIGLLTQLCEKFWVSLHPQLEEQDHEFRLSVLEWVNEKLAERLMIIPVTESSEIGAHNYVWANVVSAGNLELQSKRHPDGRKLIDQAREEGAPVMDKIITSAQQTPGIFFGNLLSQLEAAQKALVDFEKVLHTCYPNHPHSFYKIRNVLLEIGRFVNLYYTPPSVIAVPEHADESNEKLALEIPTPTVKRKKSMTQADNTFLNISEVTSREQAYGLLNLAADFLLRTEPHSPTPYVVKRAVAWGHMSLAELYQEILADEKDLAGLKQLLGVGLAGQDSLPKSKNS